jgi:hypothetical protein
MGIAVLGPIEVDGQKQEGLAPRDQVVLSSPLCESATR